MKASIRNAIFVLSAALLAAVVFTMISGREFPVPSPVSEVGPGKIGGAELPPAIEKDIKSGASDIPGQSNAYGQEGGETWIAPEPDVSAASIAMALLEESLRGNKAATCRLLTDIEACKRYSQIVDANGRMGAYDKATSESDIQRLDIQYFGRPLELMRQVCREPIPDEVLRYLPEIHRQAIAISGSEVAIQSARQLMFESNVLEPDVFSIVESAARSGNKRAVETLALSGSLPYEIYPNLSTEERAERKIYWLLLDAALKGYVDKDLQPTQSQTLGLITKMAGSISPSSLENSRDAVRRDFGTFEKTKDDAVPNIGDNYCKEMTR